MEAVNSCCIYPRNSQQCKFLGPEQGYKVETNDYDGNTLLARLIRLVLSNVDLIVTTPIGHWF